MRILFLISTITGGGAARVLTCLANQFAESGDEVGFITSYMQQDKGEYLLDSRVKRYTLSDKKAGMFTRTVLWTRRIARICREFTPDAVVCAMPEPNFRLLLGTPRNKFVRIVSVVNDPNREYRRCIYKFLALWQYKKADGIIFQTVDERDWFPSEITERGIILHNQVDAQFFNAQRGDERRNFVTTGRLSVQKDQKMLIDAFSRIADKVEDDLYIYGEGALRSQLEEQIAALGLTDRIHLPGATTDVVGKLSEARVYVLPSLYEGMPNALLEALAMGVPVISTDCPCGGPRTVIEDGVNGLLVPVGDVDALADKMLYAYNHPDEMERMGAVARERADCFRSDRVYAEWRAYIEQLIENKK